MLDEHSVLLARGSDSTAYGRNGISNYVTIIIIVPYQLEKLYAKKTLPLSSYRLH